ncbi:MAG: hypothetical protein ABEI06_08790 [Halobacteriaceae archaeon]
MHLELVIAKIITVGLGLLIAYQAYQGYRVHASQPMLYVAVGFVLISVGSVIEGVLFEVLGMSLFTAGAIQTSIVAAGMLVILYSLYGGASLTNNRQQEQSDEY